MAREFVAVALIVRVNRNGQVLLIVINALITENIQRPMNFRIVVTLRK